MSATPAESIAAVERSPQAAGAHDREGWVAVFAADARVEDPVGSRPHRGRAQIERFYDTFIGPRAITFHRGGDVVFGSTVIRDVTVEVRMGPSVAMLIPAFLRYDLDDSLRISRLQAFWELPAMMWQFARNGLRAVPAGMQLSRALLRNQKLAGTVGFLSGFLGTTVRGKQHVGRLLDDACAGDQVAVKRRLANALSVTRGDDERIGTSELVALLHGARWDGMIRAGHCVAARVHRDGCRLVLFADVETRPVRIRAVRVFADEQWT
ncbi:nuclear transport factor 2 family protein [Mycolicibacterium hodleri]|uniref:SnoaL-like domain-containing protein n=1 Tax=Mycolicibacterium hodleri TaxID=49897 RepID=A0A502EA96_9MYCO|nr:ketosteroid isomerase family protein [Mycolicibacterium hodleri]TPG33852.1 hypothetical protein EAH80_16165 [Mycolicibacterium hodleri]